MAEPAPTQRHRIGGGAGNDSRASPNADGPTGKRWYPLKEAASQPRYTRLVTQTDGRLRAGRTDREASVHGPRPDRPKGNRPRPSPCTLASGLTGAGRWGMRRSAQHATRRRPELEPRTQTENSNPAHDACRIPGHEPEHHPQRPQMILNAGSSPMPPEGDSSPTPYPGSTDRNSLSINSRIAFGCICLPANFSFTSAWYWKK